MTFTFSHRHFWEYAVALRGLRIDTTDVPGTRIGFIVPEMEDPFAPKFAVDGTGDVFGMWCLTEEGWQGFLSDTPTEFHEYINKED